MRWHVVLVVLLLLSVVPVRSEDMLTFTFSTDKETYEAQDRGVFHVTLTNDTGQAAEEINVEVKSKDIVFLVKTGYVKSLEWGSETLHFNFQVRYLSDGEYPVTVSYKYIYTSKRCQGGTCQEASDNKKYNIVVKNGEPHVSLDSNVLRVENSKTIITFRNADETAIDFQFEIVSTLNLQYESYIGYLLTSGSKEIVAYGEPGEYEGSVVVRYKDRFGRSYEKTFLVRIVIEGKKEAKPVVLNQETQVRKIQINAASTESTPSQWYAYVIVFSCLSLIGVAVVTKLKNAKG